MLPLHHGLRALPRRARRHDREENRRRPNDYHGPPEADQPRRADEVGDAGARAGRLPGRQAVAAAGDAAVVAAGDARVAAVVAAGDVGGDAGDRGAALRLRGGGAALIPAGPLAAHGPRPRRLRRQGRALRRRAAGPAHDAAALRAAHVGRRPQRRALPAGVCAGDRQVVQQRSRLLVPRPARLVLREPQRRLRDDHDSGRHHFSQAVRLRSRRLALAGGLELREEGVVLPDLLEEVLRGHERLRRAG
mmetsp:Transcript_116041/g.249309  ORF Transcript_116041/g.249309 Transcript_116041/m.249309 type:complete len:248 (+) Transcript_116041:229-972(+)